MGVDSREQCPYCLDQSEDNLVNFDNGSSHCFSCDYHVSNDSVIKGSSMINYQCQELTYRKISRGTCLKYRYGVATYQGKTCHVADYFNDEEVCGQKLRFKGKEFAVLGDIKHAYPFGWHTLHPSPRISVTITEGELDALSISEAFGGRAPVISLKNGASSAYKELAQIYDQLCDFAYVTLAFDQDEAGKKAQKEVASLFDPGKVKVAIFSENDASDMLLKGKEDELRKSILNANLYRPASLLTVSDVTEDGLEKPSKGYSWGFPSLDSMTYGLHPGRLYTICGGSGCGKTTFIRDVIAYSALYQNHKIVLLSFEETPRDVVLKLAGYSMGQVVHRPGNQIDSNEIKKHAESFDNVYIHNNEDLPSSDKLRDKLRYYVKLTGATIVVLDNLTAVTAGMVDERQGVDKLMYALSSLALQLDILVFAVSHLSKPDGLSYEEGRQITPSALRGSQSIQYYSSFILGVERNRLSESPQQRNQVTLRVLKDRVTGESDGETIPLVYTDKGILEEQEEEV